MSFFGIGKKKWDEQAREAESTAAQDGHEESKPSRGSGLSDKIMEQQQWEDSLRRFVKSEGTRQNRDEERSEEHRAVEDLKRALLHDDEEAPSFAEGSLSDTGKTTDEEERRSILEALNSYPHEDSEVAAAPEAREESNDSEAVEDAPVAPETPAFLRDDEDETSEEAEGDSSAKAEPSTDTAEDARSQFEEHLRAVRAESSAEESPATSDVDDTDHNAAAEEYLSAEQIREARTRAAIIEAKSAGLDDLAAVYAARLGLNPESEEDSFEEVEQAEDSEAVAAKQPVAEHSVPERSTEPESLSAEPTRSDEKTEPAAEVLVSETVAVEELSEPASESASEPAEPSSESEEKPEAAKDEAKKDAEDPASEPGSDEAASGEQKLSADDAELVAESIVLTAPAEGAADLPILGEQRALHSLTELMRTRGSGTLSLELRQVDEDMHYRLLHRGREVENGIVLPGVDWFAPVAALYTEAQEAGATWNRAAVTLNPRLGEGLEVHASYLGAVDGQTTHESFLLETLAREENSVVATAEAAEAAEAHQAEAPEAEASESGDSLKVEPEIPAAEAQPSEEVREEQAPEQVEHQSAPAGLSVAGATVAGAAALAASASESGEASVAEVAEYEHDYDNDPIFGTANSQDAEATSAQPEQPEVAEADEDTEPVHAQPDAAEAEDAEAEVVDHGEEMEAALAAIVANAQKKLDEPQEPEETSTEAAAFVSVEESAAPAEASVAESSDAEASNAESSAAESSAYEAPAEKGEKTVEEAASTDAEPELPTFLDDRELVPADEAEEPSKTAKAEEPEPAQARSEKAEAPAPAVTGALAAAAAVAAGGAAASAASVASSAATSAPSTPVLSELNELPTVAEEPDTPASQPVSPLVPSETQLAEGNLVLTEAQVAQRLAPVVEHLFGENGTAKDATTVLIRVRALGSYYDALTHVRRNGFWEQARTFELIPETLLDIPALKTDSYSEGEGSPLAMSLTFTPGVPVQAAFDYANEQAFVSYPRPLDAERYVEELRMFPRLGSKIPAHMTSALSHWNL